ncbi:MAG TPA: ISAzo13 family transposase, partial [Arthrobacter bacterium]|nr:ISAzo13 family transposase [Arthrobacter sp.]
MLLGVEAAGLGRGGIKAIAAATGVHPDTIARGVREAEGNPEPQARVRVPGGGRKSLAATDPDLVSELKTLVDPGMRGDPVSPLVWTTRSTRNLAAALSDLGHPVSDRTVARMLHEMGFSLQSNAKVTEGAQHEDRDAQFRHIHDTSRRFLRTRDPVV